MSFWPLLITSIIILPIILYLIGFLLPKPYQNKANLVVRASPSEVWQAVNDMTAVPVTGSTKHTIHSVTEGEDLPAWLIDMGASQVTVQTIIADEPHHLVRVLADSVVPMTARYEYHFEPMGSGTDITITEEGYIDNGTWHVPLFRIIVRVMRGAGLRIYCQQLIAHLKETTVPIINQKS